MLRLFGLNPYLRALIGIGMLVGGIIAHRPVLIGIGGIVGLWSLVGVFTGSHGRDDRR